MTILPAGIVPVADQAHIRRADAREHEGNSSSLGVCMTSSVLVTVTVPVVLSCCVAFSLYANRSDTHERYAANSLVVLSAMLAALSILIPLGATLLPGGRFTWHAWLLVGALLTGVLCMFGTIYSMIKLQGATTFTPKDRPYIPTWINATWLALGLLALSSVVVKSLPDAAQERTESPKMTAQTRFVVTRELPTLGANRQLIETKWGAPALETGSQLLYRTRDGLIVFCLDPKGLTKSITETKETDVNALRAYCE